MKVKSKYSYAYGTPDDFSSEDKSRLITAPTLNELEGKIDSEPCFSLVPKFIAVYQQNHESFSADEEKKQKDLYLAIKNSLIKICSDFRDSLEPHLIQIGHDPLMPREMVSEMFGLRENNASFDRIKLTPYNKLPRDNREKNTQEVANCLFNITTVYNQHKPSSISDFLKLIRESWRGSYDVLNQERTLFGLTSHENAFYAVLESLYEKGKKIITNVGQEFLPSLLMETFAQVARKGPKTTG